MGSEKPHKEKNPLWAFFSSIKLTLVLLIVLAATSIVGTIIPQNEGAMEFARDLSPGMLEVFTTLQLFDVYHSYWFIVLIILLAVNLIVCSINRLPAIFRILRAAPRPDRAKPFEETPPDQTFLAELSVAEAAVKAGETLRKSYGNVAVKEVGGVTCLYGEKGRFSLFGVYLVHLSVLVILLGGLVGFRYGFEAFTSIPEGETVDTVTLRKTREPRPLGFGVECVDFRIEFYPNGTPKEYRSEIRFIDGDEVREVSVLVNHPATFQGIKFYQSAYDVIPGRRVEVLVSKEPSSQETALEVEQGNPLPLPGGDGSFVVDDIRQDFMRMGLGPAARISVLPPGSEPVSFWVFLHPEHLQARFGPIMKQFPQLNPSAFEPYTFALKEVETRYTSILQVNRDPGVPLVWAGFFLIIFGLFVTFFTYHRRLWIRIEPSGSGSRVRVAGSSSKNPIGLERELKQLVFRLKKIME